MKKNVLFLCTGNSCRSQMAEGWLKHLAGDRYDVYSAGLEAHGKNPRAISIMNEAGVDISRQESTVVTDDMLQQADVVVTVCSHADEHCPVIPFGCNKKHLPFDDPAGAMGSEKEIMAEFRRVRDQIKVAIGKMISELARASSRG
jgi:arsenate reductase